MYRLGCDSDDGSVSSSTAGSLHDDSPLVHISFRYAVLSFLSVGDLRFFFFCVLSVIFYHPDSHFFIISL